MAKNTFSVKEFKTKCYFPTLFSMANLMISLMIQHNQNKVSQHGGISSRLCRSREPWVQAITSHWGQSECFPTCSLTQLRKMNNVSNFHREVCTTLFPKWTSYCPLISLYPQLFFFEPCFFILEKKKNLNNWKIFKGVWYLYYSCMIFESVPFKL